MSNETVAPEKPARESLSSRLHHVLTEHPKVSWMVIAWIIVVLAFVLLIPAVYFSWYFLPLHLWAWANTAWWHWIPAVFGFMLLFGIPVWVFMGAASIARFVADVSLEIEDASLRRAEEEAIRRLENTDAAGLLPLLRYSRAQLDAYYRMGLKQTGGSFFNAVLAMWLGFALLLIGIALYVGPVEKLGLTRPPSDFNLLIVSGAVIVEFISALFLWVYRSTIGQLTYYYRLQMHHHTSVLCFRMASTMQQAEDAKRTIIDGLLGWTPSPERPPLAGAKGLRSLLPIGGPKAEPKGEK
jgi:hypothetical protein